MSSLGLKSRHVYLTFGLFWLADSLELNKSWLHLYYQQSTQNEKLKTGFFVFLTELSSTSEKKYDAIVVTNSVPMYPAFKSK